MRYSDIPRYHLHHLQTMDTPGSGGSIVVNLDTDMVTFNEVLKLRSKISLFYGTGPRQSTGFGPRNDQGSVTRYRYAWEHLAGPNRRIVDTMWITRVPDDSELISLSHC